MIFLLSQLAFAANQGGPTPNGSSLTLGIIVNLDETTNCRVEGAGATPQAFTATGNSTGDLIETISFNAFQGIETSLGVPLINAAIDPDTWNIGAHLQVQCEGTASGANVAVGIVASPGGTGVTALFGNGHTPNLEGLDNATAINVPIGAGGVPYSIGLQLDRATTSAPSGQFQFTFTAQP